jgi:hypothetical protein
LYRVDAATGRVTASRVLHGFAAGGWATPPAPTTFLGSAGGNALLGLDGKTLRTRRRPFRQVHDLHAVPGGYVTGARRGGRVERVRADGRVRWRARATSNIGAVVGPHVYVQEEAAGNSCRPDPRFRMRVLGARTGRRLDLLKGAFFLTAPSRTVSSESQTVDGARVFCDRG